MVMVMRAAPTQGAVDARLTPAPRAARAGSRGAPQVSPAARGHGAKAAPEVGLDTTTPVVVLQLDANAFSHGSLGVIRSLGRLGVPTYAVYEQGAPAFSSRYLRRGWLLGTDPADAERVVQSLVRIAERIGRWAVLIPVDDSGAVLLAEHEHKLRDHFLFPTQHRGLPRRLVDKYALFRLCRQLGTPCPAAIMATSASQAEEFAEQVGLPVVVKTARPWGRSDTTRGYRTSIVGSRAELARLDLQRSGEEDSGVLVQEYIPGGRGQDWFFHGYRGGDGTCRPAFTGLKERSYPAHAGYTTLGRAVVNERLAAQVPRLLQRLSFHGIVDLDLRWDARDGQYKLVDFNPRVGAQFRLFRDSAGVDVAIAAHLDLTGRPVPNGIQLDRTFLVENHDPLAALGYRARGELGLRSWVVSVRGVDELAWFARDDLKPGGVMCVRMGARGVQRSLGHRNRRAATE